LFKIIKHTTAFGTLAMGRHLGYAAPITGDAVLLPAHVGPYTSCISAHAASHVLIEITEPVSIRGALNGSGWLHGGGACEFWVDYHWIGDVQYSGTPTPWIHLPPGKYLLRVKCTNSNAGAHSLWLLRPDTQHRTERLALTTIGCYPEERIKGTLKWLHRSAAQMGIHLHVFGVGEVFSNWYDMKIACLARWLSTLPEPFKYAVYMDGVDTLVLGPEDEIIRALGGHMLVSAEACCFPESSAHWRQRFQREGTFECFPQAGCWGGPLRNKHGVIDTLAHITDVRERWLHGTIEQLKPYRHFNNDQFLWQATYLLRETPLILDHEFGCFANMTCTNTQLHCTDRVRAEGRRIVCRNGNRPPCVHFSGEGKHSFGQWIGFLEHGG